MTERAKTQDGCTCDTGRCFYQNHGEAIWDYRVRGKVSTGKGLWNFEFGGLRADRVKQNATRNTDFDYGPVQLITDPPHDFTDSGLREYNQRVRLASGAEAWRFPNPVTKAEAEANSGPLPDAEVGPVQRVTEARHVFSKRVAADMKAQIEIAAPGQSEPIFDVSGIGDPTITTTVAPLALALFATDKTVAAEIARRAERPEDFEKCLEIAWKKNLMPEHKAEAERMAADVFRRMVGKR